MTLLSEPNIAPALAAFLSQIEINAVENHVRLPGRVVQAPSTVALRHELATALYAEIHTGSVPGRAVRGPRRDLDFERSLASGVPHQTSPAEVLITSPEPSSGHILAEISRTRVAVSPSALPERELTPGERVTLSLPAIRPRLSPGFLLATGSAGGPTEADDDVLRLYVHVSDPGSAPAVWSVVVRTLEASGARYRAKVLSLPESYPRRDAVVVYLPAVFRDRADQVTNALSGLAGIAADTSMLTSKVAPGIAVAWDPRDRRTGWNRMSFGQHRANALAEGITRHMADGVSLTGAVTAAFSEAGIDPAEPARNLVVPGETAGVQR